MDIKRRQLLSNATKFGLSKRLLSVPLIGGALVSTELQAKPGGHFMAASECLAKFRLDYKGIKEEATLYLAGTGYASFDNVPDYNDFQLESVMNRRITSMEWEVDKKFAGNRPDWGIVECTTQVADKGQQRAGIIFLADQDEHLFPATMINTLFVELYLPKLNLRMFNKEPIVLEGKTNNLSPEMILNDPRVSRNTSGIPSTARQVLTTNMETDFNPLGKHYLVHKEIEFYDRENPNQKVAVLLDANVQTIINYGLDIELTAAKLDDNFISAEFEIRNLVWDGTAESARDIIWYVADSHDLRIMSTKQGQYRLGAEPLKIAVQAVGKYPGKLPKEACIFCGAQNTPDTLDLTDFISGFRYTDLIEMAQL